jgi:membrane protein
LLFQVAQTGFGLYVANFAHYDKVYGSLGAVIAFLFFMYISANILLFGGELTKAYSEARLRAGEQDQPPLPGMQPGLSGRLIAVLKGLFVSR